MSTLLTPVTIGQVLDGTAHNANLDLVENSFSDLGPLVITGLVPSAGTGLSVNVTAGTAVIGGRVTKAATFSIGSLAPSTTNHLYLLQAGTGSSNTTGTQPANSVKLGTCVTDVGTVTSVDTTRTSGRQLKVRTEDLVAGGPGAGNPRSINLATWAASPANSVEVYGILPAGAVPSAGALVAPVTITADDGTQNNVTDVLKLQHTYNAGAGAAGIGTAVTFEIETGTGGTINTGAKIRSAASVVTAGSVTADLQLQVSSAGSLVTPLLVETKKVSLAQAPNAGANYGLLNVGDQGFAGGGGTNFAGSANGTGIALNLAAGFTGNLLDLQQAGVPKFSVANGGSLTLADAATIAVGTTTGTKIGTSTSQKLGFFNATPIVQPVSNSDIRTALLNLGLIAGGANPLNTNGGDITANNCKFSGAIGGSGTPFTVSTVSIVYTTDLDKTLSGTEREALIITVQTDAVLTAGRNLIVPGSAGGLWILRNLNAQTITLKTSGGTGIAVASGKTAILMSPGGVNILRVTADV